MKDYRKDTIKKYSQGKYSYNDYLKIKEWFVSQKQETLYDDLYPHWNTILKENNRSKNLDHIFKNIHYDILLKESEQKNKTKKTVRYLRLIAAIFIAAILSTGTVYFLTSRQLKENNPIASAWVEINAPLGSRIEFMLPDSTTGWLNSGSKLKYPSQFVGDRKVKLSGEGFFSVKHLNNDAEFIVSVPTMNVKVLGTTFNLSAYPDVAYTDVVLEKGKIEVIGKTKTFSQILNPNEKVSYNLKNNKTTLSKVDAIKSSAWKDGYLIIDNEPLGKAICKIERWYNVDIEILDKKLEKYRFRATFVNEPLEEVLKLIAKTTPILYSIEERTSDKKGVFEKRKVIMKLK